METKDYSCILARAKLREHCYFYVDGHSMSEREGKNLHEVGDWAKEMNSIGLYNLLWP